MAGSEREVDARTPPPSSQESGLGAERTRAWREMGGGRGGRGCRRLRIHLSPPPPPPLTHRLPSETAISALRSGPAAAATCAQARGVKRLRETGRGGGGRGKKQVLQPSLSRRRINSPTIFGDARLAGAEAGRAGRPPADSGLMARLAAKRDPAATGREVMRVAIHNATSRTKISNIKIFVVGG